MLETSPDFRYSKRRTPLGAIFLPLRRRLPSLTENIVTDQLIASNGPAADAVTMNKLFERIMSGTFNSLKSQRDQNGISVLHSDNM